MPPQFSSQTRIQPALQTAHVLLAAVATFLGLLIVPPAAFAHVTVSPSFVEVDATTTVVFETPNERAPHATTSLVLEAPPGVEIADTDPPPGWSVEVVDDTARWTGGRIEGEGLAAFPLVMTARGDAGTETFRAVQGYDDGESVAWETVLTVLPAAAPDEPSQQLGRALAAGAVGLAVIAGSLLVLRRLRKRTLQER